jgi:hypothetical protein
LIEDRLVGVVEDLHGHTVQLSSEGHLLELKVVTDVTDQGNLTGRSLGGLGVQEALFDQSKIFSGSTVFNGPGDFGLSQSNDDYENNDCLHI